MFFRFENFPFLINNDVFYLPLIVCYSSHLEIIDLLDILSAGVYQLDCMVHNDGGAINPPCYSHHISLYYRF